MRFLVIATVIVASVSVPVQAKDQREQAETAAGPGDRIVCKRFVKTGSLVDGYRTCKPKRTWERERENIRQLPVSGSCGAPGGRGGC